MGANRVEEMNYFSAAKIFNCLNCHYNCDDRISISSIFYIVLLLVSEGEKTKLTIRKIKKLSMTRLKMHTLYCDLLNPLIPLWDIR